MYRPFHIWEWALQVSTTCKVLYGDRTLGQIIVEPSSMGLQERCRSSLASKERPTTRKKNFTQPTGSVCDNHGKASSVAKPATSAIHQIIYLYVMFWYNSSSLTIWILSIQPYFLWSGNWHTATSVNNRAFKFYSQFFAFASSIWTEPEIHNHKHDSRGVRKKLYPVAL